MTQENVEQASSQQQAFAAVAEESAKIEAEKELAKVESRFFTMTLPVTLSDHEKAVVAMKLVAHHSRIEELKADAKAAAAASKGLIAEEEAEAATLRKRLSIGDMLPVNVRADKIFETNTYQVTRLDTGAVVPDTTRPLDSRDRQASLPGIPAPEPSEDDVDAEDGDDEESDDSAQTSFDHSPKEDDDVPEEEDEDEFADERPQITNPEEVLGESPAAKRARGKKG